MMSDERRRRRPSRDSSRRSRRKARRDEREYPETTLYSYPSQSQQAQPQADSPLPPITMRSSDHVRPPIAAVPMSVPIPSDLNRPQRRPRSRHGSGSTSDFSYSSSGGSSSSYLDISRWYPSFGRSGGVLNAFFKTPSEHRPRRRRSKRQVKTKKTKAIFGFGNNSSSSSVNSDMAYGMGFIKKPKSRGGDFSLGYKNTTAAAVPASAREASSSRPGMQRRQTDEEILEIGRKLAQVAREQNQEDLRRLGKKPPSQFTAAASSWDRYHHSTREQFVVGRGIAPSRLDRNHGYSSDDEIEWESASENESESSDGSSGLAYGFHDSSTPKPFPEKTSRPSTAIAPSVLQDRRGSELKSSVVDPRLFGPVNSLRDFVNTPRGFDDNRGAYSAADPGHERYTGSAGTAESASAEVRPLQTVYPIGTSDPGKMEAARASGSLITIQQNNYSTADSHDRYYSTVSTPNDRPEPVPIQAPKPIAPVPSRMYDERRAHEPERSDSRERHRRSKEYRGDRSASRDRHHQSGDYETRRNPAGSKIFAETALVGAGVAALGAALMANRDKGKGKEPEVSHDRDERYGHDDHREDDTKVQDSRRAKELALEREVERLEKALAERNKARETRKRESKRQSALADLDKNYERERDRRRSERSSRYSDTGGDVQPESSTRVSEPRGETAVARDTDYHRADNSRDPEPQKGKMDVFQYQVSDDTFQAGTQAPPPVIIDVTPAPSPAPEQNKESRRDWFEEEMRDTRHIVEEASHSTAPISEVEMAAAIAATEHSHRQGELEDRDRGRRSSRAERDRVQEEANRYYHARRIAERQIHSRSRSKSPDDDGQPPRIVTPPEMKERPKVYDYSKPNADIVFDNELSPTELRFFLPMENFVRDPSAERPRPVLNLVLPTPVPTPSPEQVAHRQKSTPRAREAADEEPLSEGPTVVISPKGEIIQIVDAPEPREEVPQPSTPKSVSWGPSETNLYEVESRETSRERTSESPERASHSGKKSSSGGWGAIAAVLAGATAGAAIARDDDKRSEGSRSPPKERPILPTGTSSRVMEEEPEELPPLPGPKPASTRSPQMPGAFDDDLEFTANVAAGLEHAGFPSDIVVENPNFHRRDSPPGSNEPFAGVYTHPFAETVSDLGIMGLDDGSGPVREPGYVLGEIADTPASEKAAAFDEPTAYETPKLSKKEQRKLEKAAKAAKLAGEEQEAARPIGGDEDEWADTSSSKKPKKSKKSKRASVSWDDEDTPVNDTAVETLGDFQATRPSHNNEDWDVLKKSKKSKRSSKSYSPTSDDSPERREHRRSAYEALEGDITSVASDSGYNKRSSGPGREDDRSVVSAPSSSDRKRDSKADKQSSGSGFWGLLKGSNGVDADGKESKKDNAGTLGAGAGLAGAAVAAAALAGGIAAARSDAAEAPSGQEEPHVGRDVDQSAISGLEDDVFDDPEIVPRVIKPAIDPQYGDLLPLPPSPAEKSSLDFEIDEDLPALPDSRPSTPPGRERGLPRECSVSGQKRPGLNTTTHPRRLSIYEAPPRSPSHTAIPIQFRMGQRPASIISPAAGRPIGSGSPALGRSSPTPQSPVTAFAQEFSPPFKKSSRPTSWDNNKEYKPLYLLEQAGRSTRETEEILGKSPEWTPLPPSRESPASEMVSETGDVPLFTDMEATKAVPLGFHESTPKVTPAAEHNLPPLAEDVESTPFETPFEAEAPFGISSTSSLPESSYATPVESPSLVTEQLPVSGHQEVEEYADVVDSGSQDRGRAVPESAQPQEQFLQEQQTQEASEAQQKKSYFPSALSMLPAATLAGVGALLGRAKHAEHTIGTDFEQQREDLPALADQTRGEDARDTTLEQQSGATEQGAAGARKSTTDTTHSSTTDIANASMPNDPAAAAPMRPEEESLPIGESRPRDAVPHDVDNSAVDLQTPAVVEAPDIPLPSLSTRDTETDPNTTTTPTEPEQTPDDMETIIETPADTIDWPTETVLEKEEGGVSDAPQIPTDDGPAAATPIDEPIPGTEATIASDVIQTEPGPAQVALPSGSAESGVAGSQDLGETPGPFDPPESTNLQDLIDATEERPASTENNASPTTRYDQGVSAGGTPLKSSSRRRLRSSRVMSPHGSVDKYMSSDAVQSGEDAPVSPASGLRTTGKKYKKTRSLRSSRRSSVASQSSGQGDMAAEQPAQVDDGEAVAAVPNVEQFRDAAEERITSTPEEVIDQPTDAQVEDVAQFLVKDAENVEEPAAREAELVMDPLPTETEPSAEASGSPILPDETQPLQPTEVAADPAPQSETPVDDEWGLTSSEKRSTSLAEAPLDMPNTETAAEKAVFGAPEIDAPQELTLATPGEHDLAQGLAAEPVVDQEHSNIQAQPVDVSANPLDSDELAKTPLTAGEPPALPRDHSETQEHLRPLEVEPALAREETFEEQAAIQPTVDEPPVTTPDHLPTAQEPEPEHTTASPEAEFPVVSPKKSKKNKKRKGNSSLDETAHSSGTATPAELEQTGQAAEAQEQFTSPVRDEGLDPALETVDDITTVKEDPQAVEINDVPHASEPLPAGGTEPTAAITEAPAVQEQGELHKILEARDIAEQPALEPQAAESEDAQAGAGFFEPAADQSSIPESSIPTEPETAEKDAVQEPVLQLQPAEPDAKPISLDPVADEASATEVSKSVEPEQAAVDEIAQPVELIEPSETAAEVVPTERLEEAEAPTQEDESPKPVDEKDILRRVAEAAQAEEEEAEIARLQGKRKLQPKEKQRLRELKAKADARAAEAEAEATRTPPDAVESLPEAEIGEIAPAEVAAGSQSTEVTAPMSAPEQTASAAIDPNFDALPEDASTTLPEQIAAPESVPESPEDAPEDPEEIARREAKAEVIRQEESELSRLQNKKKPNKKDQKRMKTLRASAELREREAEALRRQLEEQEAAADTPEVPESTPAEAEPASSEKPLADETSDAIPVDNVDPAQLENSANPDIDAPASTQTEEQLTGELDSAGQQHVDAFGDTQPEDRIIAETEDTAGADAEEAVPGLTDGQTATVSTEHPQAVAEETTPIPDYATGDVHDHSLDNQFDGQVSQDVAVQEAGDLPAPVVEQDQSSLPNDQLVTTESTMPQNSDPELVQDNALQLPSEPAIALPEYQLGEFPKDSHEPEAEIVAEPEDLPPTKSDEDEDLRERDIEQPLEEVTQPESPRETFEPPLETQNEDAVQLPASEAIPTFEMQEEEAPIEALEETPAVDAAPPEPEPEPAFATKKSKKDKKKKRKGTISEDGGQTSGGVTPAEASAPVADAELLPADEPMPQFATDETPAPADNETEPTQLAKSDPSEQVEPSALPDISGEEPPIVRADEPTSGAQQEDVPPNEGQSTQIPAAAEDEVLPTAEPEAEQDASPQEPEFTVSANKSKKDKKKRQGTISEPSPQASGLVTPTDTQDTPQEPTPKVLGRFEDPISTAELEPVPTTAADAPGQEQIAAALEEPSTLSNEAEADAAVKEPEDPKVEELQEPSDQGHEVSSPADDASLMLTHERPQTAEDFLVDETQCPETEQAGLEQEQAKSPTVLEDSSPAAPSIMAEPEAMAPPEDVAVQADEPSAGLGSAVEAPPPADEPEEVQADEFFVVPTKKSKKDKKKKRASAAWSEPESGAQTPATEIPIEPVSTDVTKEAPTHNRELSTASSDLPADEPAKESPAPLDDWAPTASSNKSKRDKKKKKRASASLPEPESGAQTPLSEELQELPDASGKAIETAEQEDADLVTQPTEFLSQEPETSSPRESTGDDHATDAGPVAAEESSDVPPEIPTSSVEPDSTTKKSGGGWGLIAAALGGGISEPGEISHPAQPAEALESENEPVALPTEDEPPVTAEVKEEESRPEAKSFDEPKAPATKSMSGWGTIAAAVAGVTVGAAAVSEDKPERDASPRGALKYVASTSDPRAEPDPESKVIDESEALAVAGGERAVAHDDSVSAPIPKPDLEDKIEDGEDAPIVSGGETVREDIEPWSFEAARDVETEPSNEPELDDEVKDGGDTVMMAPSEEPTQQLQTEDNNSEAKAEPANDFLDVDRPAIRPSSPVPWEDEDRLNEFATPNEPAPVLDEDLLEGRGTASVPTPQQHAEPEPFEFVTSTKSSKKDKKKKKRGSVNESPDAGTEVTTPVTETPRFEETQELTEPVDLEGIKPVEEEAEALDWIPKRKMSKKDKRKAKKGFLSVSEPEPVVVVPDDSQQQPADLGTSPQIIVAESKDRKDHDAPADETRQDLPWTEEPEVMLEPTDEKEVGLDAEASSTQQPQPVEERQPEDAVVKSPVLEPALQEAPVLTRKMSKKEKRKAKKRATSSWEDDVLEPSNNTVGATEDTQSLESPDATVQPEPTRDDIEAIPSPIVTTTQPAEAESNEPVTPAAEEVMAEDEWAPLSRKESKKDKTKKGKQLASEPAFTEEQPKPDFPETFAPSPSDPPVPQMFEPSAGGQSRSIENPREIATEPLVLSSNIEHVESLAEQDQPQPSTDTVVDDWEEPTERPEPTKVGLGSPAALGAELQKMPSAAPSPDIWENEDYFMPRAPNVPRDSPGDKPIEKVDIHPAFSRELRASPERGSRDERPLVGLGLIHRHSSIFQDDDGYAPELLTAGAGNFSVESLAVEEAGSSDDFFQAGKEPRSGKTVLGQRETSAPEDYAQHAIFPEPDDGHPADSFTPPAPKPPPSPGLDDVNKMSKKGSVAALAERFGGTTKKTTGKRKKVSKYVDKRTLQDDLFDEPAMWEGSERKAVEGSRLDLDAGDFWAVGDSELDEEVRAEEPDSLAGQGATTSYGQETKAGDDNVSATHSPAGQEAGEFTPQVPEQASRAEEVPMESLVVESPVLGSQASFEMSPREEQTAIEPLDRPPDIDTGQREEAGKERHGLNTPRSLSPASERGVRLDTTVSPSVEADDYAMLQGISPVSDFKRSVSRGLPPVQEEPQEEEGEVGKHGTEIGDVNRDSGVVTGSPHPPLSRHFDEFRQEQRDSGVHLRDYPNMSPRLLSPEPKRVSQSSLESEGAKLDDKPRRSPLAGSTPVLAAQETPVTPEPHKSRRRKRYPDLGPEAAAATTLAEGAALLKSNTGISRARTPEALSLTPPLRSRRTRSGDLRSLSQSSHRSHSDLSALLQPSPSPVSAAAVDPASAVKTPGPASCSSSSSDLRRPTAPPNTSPSASSHTPLANEGRVRSKDMASVYDGVGEGRLGSPRSPTRPHSMRRRQSMQVLELESRVEQLLAENHALSEARAQAELHSTNRATSTIADRDNEIESLKQSLDFMRKEIQRLTEVNEGLNSAIAQSAFQHEDRYRILESQHADATRELHAFRDSHSSTSQTIQEKDAEIRHLRDQLEDTKEQIRDMQRQILASKPADADFLRIKDVDYFDHRCQQLCSHVQQWVLRFSKFSDMRACRLTSELNDEKIIDRLDNAVLDGSNVDKYLNDRVRRRDIFMSLAMTMIWEFVFTRYLFGMDREQRQKLKALEKLLLEVGPPHAVRQWRAVTLTLLSRRDSFKTQRDQDTEAVVQAVFQTLSMILPPPSNLEDQIQSQLRKVMREAVDLSIEMRTQRAEYMMLPPLQPEYDANGDLAEPHPFNATLMNERAAGDKSVDNDDLQAQGAIVRVVLFPLVVKKGDDDGVGDDEVVVCPAQVMVARPRGSGSHHRNRSSSSRLSATRAPSSDAGGVSLLRGGGSPSTAPNRSNVSMAEAEYFEGGI